MSSNTKVSESEWEYAQTFETTFDLNTVFSGNDWWYSKFDNYNILNNMECPSILEVGAGPHTNIRYILPKVKYKRIFLEDPLMNIYTSYPMNIGMGRGKHLRYRKKSIKYYLELRFLTKWLKVGKKLNHTAELVLNESLNVDISSAKLEDLNYKDNMMDLVICNNVVDHVQDLDKCSAKCIEY